MSTLIIIGIILFFITLYVHKHTYDDREYYAGKYTYNKEDRMPLPLWLLIVAFILSIIPIVNIILYAVFLVIYIVGICEKEIYFVPTGIVEKIKNILTKEV